MALPSQLPGAVVRHAPEAAEHLAAAQQTAASVVDAGLVELARLRIDGLLGAGVGPSTVVPADKVAALAQWPTSPAFDVTERSCLRLAEQFAIDPAAITDDDVGPVLDALGVPGLYGFVQALWVLDLSRRLEVCVGAVLPEAAA